MDEAAGRPAMMTGLQFVFVLTAMLTLTGCPGPNYAPYNNMRNSYGMNGTGAAPILTPPAPPADRAASG